MTQEALAVASGVSVGYVSQIERGARQPSRKVLAEFGGRLNLEIEDLA